MHQDIRPRRRWGLLIAGCMAVSLFSLVYPIYVIWPFRHQGAVELQTALLVVRFRLVAVALSAVAALVAAVFYWRAQKRWGWRILSAAATALVLLASILCRVNIYELMFHPAGKPAFASADQTKLDRDEMVIAVQIAGDDRAYPIRNISYHHIVNDWLGGVPIVATY